jgi:hypothetical protein
LNGAHQRGDEGAIEEQADAVAQRGWPHDRQEGIRAGADAVVAHRVGEAVVAIGKVNGLRLATSNRPPMPSVELIMKRPSFSALCGFNWSTKFTNATGSSRL